jgi:hypothetical protein
VLRAVPHGTCTATMNTDPETKEPILHIGGFTIREEVEKAIEKERARNKKEKER